jgi:uncharacterized membrane protein
MPEKKAPAKKMTFGETLKFIITGKKPDGSSIPLKKKQKKTQKSASSNSATQTKEEEFEKESGMTIKKAEEMLKKWYQKGEKAKLQKGAQLIGKYFPDHFSQKFLEKNNTSAHSVFSEESSKEKTPEKQEKTKNIQKKNANKKLNKEETETETEEEAGEEFLEEESPVTENFSGESIKKFTQNPLKTVGVSFEAEEGLPDENEIEDPERLFGAIAYIPFFSIFVILTQKESPFAQFHGWQAFAFLAIIIAISSFKIFFFWIPGFSLLLFMSSFLIFLLSFFSAITAFKGRYINIPLISKFAKILSGREK